MMKFNRHTIWLILIVLLYSAWAVPSVSAHAVLLRSNPSANAVLEQPPVQVELFFSEPLEAGLSSISVVDSNNLIVDVGIQVAKAHDVPSDWWSMPVTGGAPTRLTQIQTINLFARISPDKNHIASLSGEGIFVMNWDGSNLTQLAVDPGVSGTVSWIP